MENPIIPSDEFNFMLKSITEESLSQIKHLQSKKGLKKIGSQVFFFSADDFLKGRSMDTLEVLDESLKKDELEKIGVEYAYSGNFVPVCVFFSELKKKKNDTYFTVVGQTFDGRINTSNVKISKTMTLDKKLKYNYFNKKEKQATDSLQNFYKGYSAGLIMKNLVPINYLRNHVSNTVN